MKDNFTYRIVWNAAPVNTPAFLSERVIKGVVYFSVNSDGVLSYSTSKDLKTVQMEKGQLHNFTVFVEDQDDIKQDAKKKIDEIAAIVQELQEKISRWK